MRTALILLSVLAVVNAGDDMKKMKQWMKLKAFEGCYGEDNMKTWMVKVKGAMNKCSGEKSSLMDHLPMFSNINRVLHGLLMGAKDTKMKQASHLIQHVMGNKHHSGENSGEGGSITLNLNMGSGGQDMMHGLMKKMMMMKMMKHFHQKMHKMDFDDDDDMMFTGGSSEMMMDDDDDDKDDQEDFRAVMRLVRSAMMNRNVRRNRRQAEDEDDVDVFALGEKLNEKLMAQKMKVEAKAGNMSCILQEMGMIDADMKLNLDGIIKCNDMFKWDDEWFKEKHVKNNRMCYAMAEAMPAEVLNESPYGPEWCKIKKYMMCDKMLAIKTCMAHDIKKKLESNFGPLKELEEQTGLSEKQLLPLAGSMLHDEMMAMME